jgi:hypothetical protein
MTMIVPKETSIEGFPSVYRCAGTCFSIDDEEMRGNFDHDDVTGN